MVFVWQDKQFVMANGTVQMDQMKLSVIKVCHFYLNFMFNHHVKSKSLIIGNSCDSQAWQCKSGQCLPQYAFCNAVPDCLDGSDEDEEICESCN